MSSAKKLHMIRAVKKRNVNGFAVDRILVYQPMRNFVNYWGFRWFWIKNKMLRPMNERRYVIGNDLRCRFRVHARKPMSFKTRGMFLFVHQALFWPKCLVHENRHNSRFGSHPMPIVAARSDICNMTHLAPAGTGGCYVGAPPRPRCAIYGNCGVH